MRVMIDTHVLLWWLDDPGKLSDESRQIIENIDNIVFVSSAVIWEIVIKKQLGKLVVPDGLPEILAEENFLPLSISHEHSFALATLPDIHSDPFDRIQIAQAICENLVFITRDRFIRQYKKLQFILA